MIDSNFLTPLKHVGSNEMWPRGTLRVRRVQTSECAVPRSRQKGCRAVEPLHGRDTYCQPREAQAAFLVLLAWQRACDEAARRVPRDQGAGPDAFFVG